MKKYKLLLCLSGMLLLTGCSTPDIKSMLHQSQEDTEQPVESNAGYYMYLTDSFDVSVAEVDTTYYQTVLKPNYALDLSTLTPDNVNETLQDYVESASEYANTEDLENKVGNVCLMLDENTVVTLYYMEDNPFTGANSLTSEDNMWEDSENVSTLFTYKYCTGFENGTSTDISSALTDYNIYFYYNLKAHVYGEIVSCNDSVPDYIDTISESITTLYNNPIPTEEETVNTIMSFGLGGSRVSDLSLEDLTFQQNTASYDKSDELTTMDGNTYNLYLCTGPCYINGMEYTPTGKEWLCLDKDLTVDMTYTTITPASMVQAEDVSQVLNGQYMVGYDFPNANYYVEEGIISVYYNPNIITAGEGALNLEQSELFYQVTAGQSMSLAEGSYIVCDNVKLIIQ